MKILITGASGFVGGALWRHCEALGHEVLATGRRPLEHPQYRQRDLAQPFSTPFRPDVVVHAAARSSPWGTRQQFIEQNITATRHLVEYCAASGHPHLIYISTSAVLYRNEHQLGMDESTAVPPRFINQYAWAKHAGEELVRAYPGAWTILRPRAVFGPGDTVVFPRILKAARSGRLPLIESHPPAWGDLIYIDSLVDYIVRAAAHRTTGLYHLTNNQPIQIVPFLLELFRRLGIPQPKRRINASVALFSAGLVEGVYRALRIESEPPVTRFGISVFAYSKTFNVAKALRDLGPPSVSLENGVDAFVNWQRQHLS